VTTRPLAIPALAATCPREWGASATVGPLSGGQKRAAQGSQPPGRFVYDEAGKRPEARGLNADDQALCEDATSDAIRNVSMTQE
jgi:hypothetical protein